MPTLSDFRMLFPELDAIDDVRVQFFIDRAIAYLSETAFGSCYNDAVLFWAAHKLMLSEGRAGGSDGGANAGAGPISAASVNGVSVSYATPSFLMNATAQANEYGKTAYGQEYLAIRNTCLPMGRLAGVR